MQLCLRTSKTVYGVSRSKLDIILHQKIRSKIQLYDTVCNCAILCTTCRLVAEERNTLCQTNGIKNYTTGLLDILSILCYNENIKGRHSLTKL